MTVAMHRSRPDPGCTCRAHRRHRRACRRDGRGDRASARRHL